jgi:predicted transcriptional regulator
MLTAQQRIVKETTKLQLFKLTMQEPMTVQELSDALQITKNVMAAHVETMFRNKYLIRLTEKEWCADAGRKVYVYKADPNKVYKPRMPTNKKPIADMTAQEKTQYKKDLLALKPKPDVASTPQDNDDMPSTSKPTVVKVNSTTTLYLNSNKPAGWYKWQKNKRTATIGIASTFSLI